MKNLFLLQNVVFFQMVGLTDSDKFVSVHLLKVGSDSCTDILRENSTKSNQDKLKYQTLNSRYYLLKNIDSIQRNELQFVIKLFDLCLVFMEKVPETAPSTLGVSYTCYSEFFNHFVSE